MSASVSLSIVVPTAGRLSLEATLRSYAHQMAPDDEVLVMGDTTDGPLPETEAIVARFGARFRYVAVPSTFHSWGHLELNAGFKLARGAWLLGNDDDDVAPPDALAIIRTGIAAQPYPRPLLFQFVTPWRQVLWASQDIVEGAIGGHCLVQPNAPGRVAELTARYSGDADYIAQAAELYYGDVAWIPGVIAWTRPTAEELARLVPAGVGGVNCQECGQFLRNDDQTMRCGRCWAARPMCPKRPMTVNEASGLSGKPCPDCGRKIKLIFFPGGEFVGWFGHEGEVEITVGGGGEFSADVAFGEVTA